MSALRVAVIGAGVAGLTAALELAVQGADVIVLERQAAPGGKMRQVEIAGSRLDAGPTVLTMRWVFEEIFAQAGASLAAHVSLRAADVLARHAWSERERLDLYADADRSAQAIAAFAGAAEAKRYLEFAARAQSIYRTLERPFLRSSRPRTPLALMRSVGPRGMVDLWRIAPFATLWGALGKHFQDPRLRQLFARYATYCGSSPFSAPATLMLIAHVERDGVWLVQGGMYRLAEALAGLAERHGATFRYNAPVGEIVVGGARAVGVKLANGEFIAADAVILNADVAAVASGHFGKSVVHAVPPTPRKTRSLSALTWTLIARTAGFPLLRHNVFFSRDYRAEFDDIFRRRRLPLVPTVYVCAQDRDDCGERTSGNDERLLCLVNAPPSGDTNFFTPSEIARCEQQTFAGLERCGLQVQRRVEATTLTTPAQFEQLFPATGGALYGRASHGWSASFRRPGSRSRIPGLYLAGGSTHPGPGVPMAALSGRLAAASVLADSTSIGRSRRAGTHGGMSTRLATTGSMDSR